MAILRALGVLEDFSAFPLPFDPRKLARHPATMAHGRDMLMEIQDLLCSESADPALWRAAEEALAHDLRQVSS